MGEYARSRRSPAKRSRRDYDDIAYSRATYGSSRSGILEVGRGYGDRSPGFDLRDYMPVPYGEGLSFERGIGSAGLGASLIGTGGLGAVIGPLDDPGLYTRLAAYDTGLGGRPSLHSNGATFKSESAMDILPEDASSTLFVDGLPLDCSRREAAHIFRPFVGFKDIRVVHKDVKRDDADKIVLCFVDFADARCAATALDALQGYKFDEKDPDSYTFRVSFAKYPAPRRTGYRDRSPAPARGRDRSPFYRRDRRR